MARFDNYIAYLDLATSGHVQWRRDDRIEQLLPLHSELLDQALASDRVPITTLGYLLPGFEIQARATGRCVLLTIWHDQKAVLALGVADNGSCGVRLWDELMKGADPSLGLPNRRLERPQAPWAASHPGPNSATRRWDLEKPKFGPLAPALAWAWLARCDRRGGPRDPATFQRAV